MGRRGKMDSKLLLQLYEKYSRELYLYFYSLCHNSSLAEDLLQETFLKAILSLSSSHKNMRAWLYMVGRNLYYDHIRREKKQVSLDELEWEAQDNHEVIDQVLMNEQKKELYHAMNQLKGKQKEVLLLQYFGQLSQKQIASVLHITPENVRVLSYRAKKELRKILGGVTNRDIS